jgi:uncharacterized protein
MILRIAQDTLVRSSQDKSVTFLTGPRQSGKTSLARAAFPDKNYLSLDSPQLLEDAHGDPAFFLSRLPKGGIIDEAQRCPELVQHLIANSESENSNNPFIIISSVHFPFIDTSVDRIGLVRLLPLSLPELEKVKKNPDISELLFYGFYPAIFNKQLNPSAWYSDYMLNFIERDLRRIVNIRDQLAFSIFIKACAAACGQTLNLSTLADGCGITHNTAKAWVSALEASHIVFLLQPHRQTFGRRTVKSPKLFFYDSGLAASLLGIREPSVLFEHQAAAGLFESFILSEILKARFNAGLSSNLFYWRDSSGNEINVIAERGEALIPFQINASKEASAPDIAMLAKWRKLNKQPTLPASMICCDTEENRINGFIVYPWYEISYIAPLLSGTRRANMHKG